MAYLVADIVIAGRILTCHVIVRTVCVRSLSIFFVSLIISNLECSSILASSCGKIGSCGSTSIVEGGSYVSVFFSTCGVFSLQGLVLPTVGSYVTTLGLVTLVVACDIGKMMMGCLYFTLAFVD